MGFGPKADLQSVAADVRQWRTRQAGTSLSLQQGGRGAAPGTAGGAGAVCQAGTARWGNSSMRGEGFTAKAVQLASCYSEGKRGLAWTAEDAAVPQPGQRARCCRRAGRGVTSEGHRRPHPPPAWLCTAVRSWGNISWSRLPGGDVTEPSEGRSQVRQHFRENMS